MARILYVGTHGTDDPTAATFPFLMAKGALDAPRDGNYSDGGSCPADQGQYCPANSWHRNSSIEGIDGLSGDPRGPNLGLRTLRPGPWGH
jgi:hypothetical protein